MIDAECQQLHNSDYRFDGSINGGINGVFGFSGDWGYFWGVSLDFLPWSFWWVQTRQNSDCVLAGIYCSLCKLVCWAILGFFPVWANLRVG